MLISGGDRQKRIWILHLLTIKLVSTMFAHSIHNRPFMVAKKIRDTKVITFANNLSKTFKIDKLIFYGSRAMGTAHPWSDYDFIVVSPDFKKLHPLERISTMQDFWKFNEGLEALGYTPAEFERMTKGVNIVSEAVREGIKII